LRDFLIELEEKVEFSSSEEVLRENMRIREMLKRFSSLINDFFEKKPRNEPKLKKPTFTLEVLEKRSENNRKLLVNLAFELEKIRRKEAKMQKIEDLEPEIQRKRDKIKLLYAEIHEINQKKSLIGKELLETSGNTSKKAEIKRLDNEIQRFDAKNQEIKARNLKIDEKIDKLLAKFDEIKEKLKKSEIVALKHKICLSDDLKSRFEDIQKRISLEKEAFAIINKRDEMAFKTLEKAINELKGRLSETEVKITDFIEKIAEQEKLLVEKSLEDEKIKDILARNTDPRRLFLEKNVRKKDIIVKELKKPISLLDLNKKTQDFGNNEPCLSIEKGLQPKEIAKKHTIFTVPFRIKHGKAKNTDKNEVLGNEGFSDEKKGVDSRKFQENFNRKYQIDEKSENRVWSLQNEENVMGKVLKTEPIEKNIEKFKEIDEKNSEKINEKIKEKINEKITEINDFTNNNTNNNEKTLENTNIVKTVPMNIEIESNKKKSLDKTNNSSNNTNNTSKIVKEIPCKEEKTFNFNQKKKSVENSLKTPQKPLETPQKPLETLGKPIEKGQKTEKKNIFQDLPENEFEIPEIKTINTETLNGKNTEIAFPDEKKKKSLINEPKNDFFEDLDV